jgi:hypothetical protein
MLGLKLAQHALVLAPHFETPQDVSHPELSLPVTIVLGKNPSEMARTSSLFRAAQRQPATTLALCASAASPTISTSARASFCGTTRPLLRAAEAQRAGSSTPSACNSATTGNAPMAVRVQARTTYTSAPAAGAWIMELRSVLEARRLNALTPYHADTWRHLLEKSGLIRTYSHIPHSLQYGFLGSISPITSTYTPPNNPSVDEHADAFAAILEREFSSGRYLGPLSKAEVEALIGPFQTAPLSIIPKPGKQGRFRLIQNLSHSFLSVTYSIASINSSIDSNLYPCTYGTFTTICLLVWRLPPGSQGATRDVAEAYRTVPLHPSQYPGLVVRTSEDCFAIDTSFCFGCSSAAGSYGGLADAGADIIRSEGIGPLSKWVDDHLFFRILLEFLEGYNEQRKVWAKAIHDHGGLHIDGGRKWYRGLALYNDQPEEYDEDCSFPILDLSQCSPRSAEDARYSYCMDDINTISTKTGTPWEVSKDIQFCSEPPFTGFTWKLDLRTIEIPEGKKKKYLDAISEWEAQPRHVLLDVQKLHGKLLHATLVVPAGRAYITELEAMLSIFGNRPFVPHTPPRNCAADLRWWSATLCQSTISRSVPGPCIVLDPNAFSDASSGVGIAIWVDGWWRAWRLIPGWKRDGRDIGWAEAVGFEFLVLSIIQATKSNPVPCFKVYGDNRGVVEGWWKGRSRNRPTNSVFKRVHNATQSASCVVLTRYVPSALNPADDPSRGRYPPRSLLLPPIPIPPAIRDFIVDFDAPLHANEQSPVQHPFKVLTPTKNRCSRQDAERAIENRVLERQGEELFQTSQVYLSS